MCTFVVYKCLNDFYFWWGVGVCTVLSVGENDKWAAKNEKRAPTDPDPP